MDVSAPLPLSHSEPARSNLAHTLDAMAMLERDRWVRLQPLLDCALELSDEQRASWLDSLRSTDPDVVAELNSLLSEEAAADGRGFLSGPLEQIDVPLRS